jgi:hypothetical protein
MPVQRMQGDRRYAQTNANNLVLNVKPKTMVLVLF